MELKFHKNAKIFFVNDSGMVENSSALMKASYEKLVQCFNSTENVKFVSAAGILSSQNQTNSATENVYVLEDGQLFENFVSSQAIVIGPGTISNSQLRIHVSATNSSMTQDACLSGKDLQMRTKMDELTNFMGGLTTENVTNQTITNTLNFETARNDALQIELTELLTNESAIIDFNIDTTERMNRIIVLIFEKTIDEPNSVAYAQLCHKLSKKSFAINAQSPKLFLKTLIGKCQNEFENHVIVESEGLAENLQSILQKIAETTDVDRKAEYEANYDEEKRKIRRRSVGTVRFIGELFKLGMLTPAIMIHCVSKLLDRNSEDKLECACKLLTTIGGRLEDKKNFLHFHALREYFRQMQEIVDRTNESSQISRRVRFLIQDVIDLRKNNWITRKEVASAKKEKHIQYRRRLMLSKVTSNC